MNSLKCFEYYRTDLGVLYNADCRKILPELESGIPLLLTDPPYGINIIGGKRKTIGGAGRFKGSGKKIPVKQYSADEWDKFDIREIIGLLKEKTLNQLIFGYNYIADILGRTNSLIIWDKKCRNEWEDNFSDGEIIYSSFPHPLRIFRLLFMGLVKEVNDKKEHPTQKPLKLILWLLQKFSEKEQLILDPFAGSGTTAVACEALQRRWIAVEISEDYCRIAKRRIEQENRQLKIL